MPGRSTTDRTRGALRALLFMATGAVLVVAVVGGDLLFDGGRVVAVAFGRDALQKTCSETLAKHLAEKGFEPRDLEFGAAPRFGPPWSRERTYGDEFTFVDGAEETRVDGVMACLVSGTEVVVDFRVGSKPRRTA